MNDYYKETTEDEILQLMKESRELRDEMIELRKKKEKLTVKINLRIIEIRKRRQEIQRILRLGMIHLEGGEPK